MAYHRGCLGVLWGMRRSGQRGVSRDTAFLHRGPRSDIAAGALADALLVRVDHWQYFGCTSVIALAAAGITMAFGVFGKRNPLLKPVFLWSAAA